MEGGDRGWIEGLCLAPRLTPQPPPFSSTYLTPAADRHSSDLLIAHQLMFGIDLVVSH